MKRLYKSRKNKIVAGVCGGIAEYFGVDPVLIRVLFIFFFLFGGSGIVAYIIAVLIIPQEPLPIPTTAVASESACQGETAPGTIPPSAETSVPVKEESSANSSGSLIVGILLVAIGSIFLLKHIPLFNDYYYWLRHNFWNVVIPAVLVISGIALIFKRSDK